MFSTSAKPLNQMSLADMRDAYRHLAQLHGLPDSIPAGSCRFELGKRIALLLSTPKPKAKPAATRRPATAHSSPRREAIALELNHVVSYKSDDTTKTPAEWEAMVPRDRERFHAMGYSYPTIVNRLAAKGLEVSVIQLRKMQLSVSIWQKRVMPTRPIERAKGVK